MREEPWSGSLAVMVGIFGICDIFPRRWYRDRGDSYSDQLLRLFSALLYLVATRGMPESIMTRARLGVMGAWRPLLMSRCAAMDDSRSVAMRQSCPKPNGRGAKPPPPAGGRVRQQSQAYLEIFWKIAGFQATGVMGSAWRNWWVMDLNWRIRICNPGALAMAMSLFQPLSEPAG